MPNFLVNENYKHTNLCFVHWIGLHFTKQAQLSRFLSTYCSYNIKCHYRSKCGERRILPWTSRVAQVDTNFFIRNNAVMWYVLLWNKYGYESSESDTKIKTIIRIRLHINLHFLKLMPTYDNKKLNSMQKMSYLCTSWTKSKLIEVKDEHKFWKAVGKLFNILIDQTLWKFDALMH